MKVTYDRGTFTLVEVTDRSTATNIKREERDVYSRGTVTDVVQRRHMAVNTDVVETKEPVDLLIVAEDVDSTQMQKVDHKDAWTRTEALVAKDTFTETENSILSDIGAVVNAATETVCHTVERETSAGVETENKSSLAVPEMTDMGCSVNHAQEVADVSTITDTVQTTDSETCWDLSNLRTFSTNTEIVCTSEAASGTSVSVKEQSSQMEEPLDTKEVLEVGVQACLEVTETGFGEVDVNVIVCDKCSNITYAEVSVSASESDFCKTRTIGTNHSVVTRSVGTGSFTVFENKYFMEDIESDKMCNACREKLLHQGTNISNSRVSVGVGGETTVEKHIYSAGENMTRPQLRLDSSPTNRSFPATNPKERRRPRSHSSPSINTAGFFTDQHLRAQHSSVKLSFPDPPDFTRFKWSAPEGNNQQEVREGDVEKANSSSHRVISEGDDTSALEESTESIFRAEETVLRRNRPPTLQGEANDVGESPQCIVFVDK